MYSRNALSKPMNNFAAFFSPRKELLSEIGRLSPDSPFNSPAYAEALASRNVSICALATVHDDRLVEGCLAVISGRPWYRRLKINSVPYLVDSALFWQGVQRFCHERRIREIEIQTFASKSPSLPTFGREVSSTSRCEYVIDLDGREFPESFSNNHRQSVRKARKAGVEIRYSQNEQAYQWHVEMMQASMQRRIARGENVPLPEYRDFDCALLKSGAGELYQAFLDERVIASSMILRTASSGYYYLAGTTPEGMKVGASPLLICTIAETLAAGGCTTFNLGGANPSSAGLRQFKRHFGAVEIELTATVRSLVSPFVRRILTIH